MNSMTVLKTFTIDCVEPTNDSALTRSILGIGLAGSRSNIPSKTKSLIQKTIPFVCPFFKTFWFRIMNIQIKQSPNIPTHAANMRVCPYPYAS